MYTDTHAHLTCPKMLEDVDAVVARAQEAGVNRILNICTDEPSLEAGLALVKKYPWISNAAAATPHDVATLGDTFFKRVQQEVRAGTLVALGETGLDYYYELSPRELQQEHLLRYIDLARESGLPLIIHCRDAYPDLFALTDAHLKEHPTVLHCFTGTLEEAKQVVDRGWFLSLSGIVTFKKSEDLRAVAAFVPLSQLLIETDSPYLAPQKWRGKLNEPAFVVETARLLAEIKGVTLEELAQVTQAQAAALFG